MSEEETWGDCAFPGLSQDRVSQLCYTLEAVRHAQSAFLCNIILTQIINGLSYRTITDSLFNHVLDNWTLNIAYIIENLVVSILLYVPGLNTAFGYRAIRFEFWVPCMGVYVVYFLFYEFHKWLLRNIKNPDGSKGFFSRYFQY